MTYPRAWNSTLRVRRERPRRVRNEEPKGEGASILHSGPFRSQTLRDLAAQVPHCMYSGCKVANLDGRVVLAHSNHLQDGKGMGIKAHDVPCFVCGTCHRLIDEEGREDIRLDATYNSVAWCLSEGHLVAA